MPAAGGTESRMALMVRVGGPAVHWQSDGTSARGAGRTEPEMPTYEYACKQCGHHLEIVQSFRDASLTECPACGGPLRKVFGSIGISFKGSGFYRTDSRTAGSKPAKAAEGGEAKTSAGDGAKTDGAKSAGDKIGGDGGAKGKSEAKSA